MKLSSEVFGEEERIPDRFTCEGEDISPPLSIEEADPSAESFALIVDDPDAPIGVFVHWLIWNIPGETDRIPSGIEQEGNPPGLEGAVQGENDFDEIGYRGPCPPGSSEHKYRFNLYALDQKLNLDPGSRREKLQDTMEGNVIEKALLRGTYSR